MPDSDESLLKAFALNRDGAAFRTLAERYSGLIFHTALRRTNSRPLAEEVRASKGTDKIHACDKIHVSPAVAAVGRVILSSGVRSGKSLILIGTRGETKE